MDDGVPSFPLFNLPDDSLKFVLQNMELIHQIGFSILSKKSKILVESLNLKVQRMIVTIGVQVSMEVHSPQFQQIDFLFHIDDDMPGFVRTYAQVYREREIYEWKKMEFEIKDWIQHLFSIFNRSKVDTLCFNEGENLFSLRHLQGIINDVIEIDIKDEYSSRYIQQIVQAFPFAKQLSLLFDTIENLEECHNIFCQGLDILTLVSLDEDTSTRCKLDDLLIMNSRSIQINSDITEKLFNSFLKHWINGSNPRIEHMAVWFTEEDVDEDEQVVKNKEIVLNGLNYQIVPNEHERTFKKLINGYVGFSTGIVRGGYDIQRMDGKTATIIFHKEDQMNSIFDLEVFISD